MHTGPDEEAARYPDVHTSRFGEQVKIPEPAGVGLETEILKNYAYRARRTGTP